MVSFSAILLHSGHSGVVMESMTWDDGAMGVVLKVLYDRTGNTDVPPNVPHPTASYDLEYDPRGTNL